MSTNEVRSNDAARNAGVARIDMKLEVVVIPVSDVDRAKEFYERIGWRLNIDRSAGEDFRLVQFTPPGSCCSVHFGKNVTSAAPGSAKAFLIVADIVAARDQLVAAGVEVGEFFHDGPEGRGSGLHPERLSYRSRALFSDPDGNGWQLQEVTTRLPGRVEPGATSFGSASDLASAFRRAEAAHGEHEKRIGQRDAGEAGMPPTWWRSSQVQTVAIKHYYRDRHCSRRDLRHRQQATTRSWSAQEGTMIVIDGKAR
jgi:catechol 2,3-dioxygenase-like lactoylglutathione lyase family enzyme